MNSKEGTRYLKFIFIGLFIIILYFSFLIAKSFISTMLFGVMLAYVFYPVYSWIEKRINHKKISAILTILIVLLAILIPIAYSVNIISSQARTVYGLFRVYIDNDLTIHCTNIAKSDTIGCKAAGLVSKILENPNVKAELENGIVFITKKVIEFTSNLIMSIPMMLLQMIILLIVLYYGLKKGNELVKEVETLLPMKDKHKKDIIKKVEGMIYAIVYGHLIMALVQGVLTVIVFSVLGIKSAFILGFLVALLALIPFIGPSFVWIPVAISKFVEQQPIIGIIVIIFGLCISAIDMFGKTKIIGEKSNVHFLLILLGVLGGAQVFGPIGLIAGPITLGLLATFIQIYKTEKLGKEAGWK